MRHSMSKDTAFNAETTLRHTFLCSDSQCLPPGDSRILCAKHGYPITGKSFIGRHEVLLPINHNFNKICDTTGYFLNQNTRNSKFCFASSDKKSHLSARVMARTVQLLRYDVYCPMNCPIGQLH